MNQISYFLAPGLIVRKSDRQIAVNIIEIVCNYYKVDYEDLVRTQRRENVIMRNITFFFIKKYTKLTYGEIGRLFRKDHSTIIHSLKKLSDLCEMNYSDIVIPKKDIQKMINQKLINN